MTNFDIELPSISIGMPIYRDGRECNFAVESVLAQSVQVSEIIISDNNPNRSKSDIYRWTRDHRVKYINTGENIGSMQNFTRAWKNSSNRYFMFLGDDDFLHPSFANSVSNHIANSESKYIAWSFLPSVHLPNKGSIISGDIFSSIDSTSSISRFHQVRKYGQWNYLFYSVYDKSQVSIDELQSFYDAWPSYSSGIDWAWTYGIALLGSTKLIPEQLFFYCQDNWHSKTEYTDRETSAFNSFLKPRILCEDTNLAIRLNFSILLFFYIFKIFANKYISEEVAEENLAYQALYIDEIKAIFNFCFLDLWEDLEQNNTNIASDLKSIFLSLNGIDLLLGLISVLDHILSDRFQVLPFAKFFLVNETYYSILQLISFSPPIQPKKNNFNSFAYRIFRKFRSQNLELPKDRRLIYIPLS